MDNEDKSRLTSSSRPRAHDVFSDLQRLCTVPRLPHRSLSRPLAHKLFSLALRRPAVPFTV